MKLLDTTFLIQYWGGRDAVANYLERNDEEEFLTTTLNLKEITVGRALQGELDRAELSERFDWLEVVPFTVEHSIVAGELEAALHRDENVQQDRINALTADLLIAAVAKERSATIVTRNTDDFEQFDGVSVETY